MRKKDIFVLDISSSEYWFHCSFPSDFSVGKRTGNGHWHRQREPQKSSGSGLRKGRVGSSGTASSGREGPTGIKNSEEVEFSLPMEEMWFQEEHPLTFWIHTSFAYPSKDSFFRKKILVFNWRIIALQ